MEKAMKRVILIFAFVSVLIMLFCADACAYEEAYVHGDFNDDGVVDIDDVLLLLKHYFRPERYFVKQSTEFDGSEGFTTKDIIYLLNHVLYPEEYSIDASRLLQYALLADGSGYSVSGIGECRVADIVIPSEINGIAVKSIDSYAFAGCSDITEINVFDSVTRIGAFAFWNCPELAAVILPDGIERINSSTFGNCENLANVCIPYSVKSIGYRSFYNCTELTDITYSGTKEQWSTIRKGAQWSYNTAVYTIHCIDGDIVQ